MAAVAEVAVVASGPAIRPTTLAAPDGATHHVLLGFEASDWTAVRALQALLAMDGAADVLVSHPSRSEVEQGAVKERLEMWLRSEKSTAELGALLATIDETRVLSLLLAEELAATSDIEWTAPTAPRAADIKAAEGPRPAARGGVDHRPH